MHPYVATPFFRPVHQFMLRNLMECCGHAERFAKQWRRGLSAPCFHPVTNSNKESCVKQGVFQEKCDCEWRTSEWTRQVLVTHSSFNSLRSFGWISQNVEEIARIPREIWHFCLWSLWFPGDIFQIQIKRKNSLVIYLHIPTSNTFRIDIPFYFLIALGRDRTPQLTTPR